MAGRGRPKAQDSERLVEINKNPDLVKRYKTFIANIQHYLREQERAADGAKDVIATAAEELNLSKGFLKKTAIADLKGTKSDILATAEAIVEGVEILEKKQSDDPEADDSF